MYRLATFIVCVCCGLSINKNAHCANVRFRFEGKVEIVDAPLRSEFSPDAFLVGDRIKGTYIFDLETPDVNFDPLLEVDNDPTFGNYNAIQSFEMSVGGYVASATAGGIEVFNFAGGQDTYEVISSGGTSAAPVNGHTLKNINRGISFPPSTQRFSSDALPRIPPSLAGNDGHWTHLNFGGGVDMWGTLTSLRMECSELVAGAVHPVESGNGMTATFTPNFGLTLDEAADVCEVDHFNWVQWVTFDDDALRPIVGGVQPTVPYMDPPLAAC